MEKVMCERNDILKTGQQQRALLKIQIHVLFFTVCSYCMTRTAQEIILESTWGGYWHGDTTKSGQHIES